MHATVDVVVNVQVKRVPEAWHDTLKRRAAERAISLNDLLLEILEREVSMPTLQEWNREAKRLADRIDASDDLKELVRSQEFWDEVRGRWNEPPYATRVSSSTT
ncbi:MAG TPA: hypothetical protein VNZ66_07995 [Aeromicrobium sp.]|nr:hypothetical protein [Aeromicrobium sp.]